MERIRELAQQEIDLEAEDIEELANTAEQLQVMADVSGSDVFIDCLCKGRLDQAVVVAQAKPQSILKLHKHTALADVRGMTCGVSAREPWRHSQFFC